MAELQLSVRSARAHEIAHRIADREKRSVASVVERALQIYEASQEKQNDVAVERLGSGLIDHNQKATVAAMQMAEKKAWAHRS